MKSDKSVHASIQEGGNDVEIPGWGRVINVGIYIAIIFLTLFVVYISFVDSNSDEELLIVTFTPTENMNRQIQTPLPDLSSTALPSATVESLSLLTQTPIIMTELEPQIYYGAKVSCRDIDKVNLRRSPGYISKNDNKDVITEVSCNENLVLLLETRYKDELTWWKVGWRNYEGWISDHTGSGKVILEFIQPTVFSQSDPASFVFWYFNAVWRERDYNLLWDKYLTAAFQNHSSSGDINSYIKWWDTVERIDVNSIKVIENDGKDAWVKINVTFYLIDGRVLEDREYDYVLVFDTNRKTWLLNYH